MSTKGRVWLGGQPISLIFRAAPSPSTPDYWRLAVPFGRLQRAQHQRERLGQVLGDQTGPKAMPPRHAARPRHLPPESRHALRQQPDDHAAEHVAGSGGGQPGLLVALIELFRREWQRRFRSFQEKVAPDREAASRAARASAMRQVVRKRANSPSCGVSTTGAVRCRSRRTVALSSPKE